MSPLKGHAGSSVDASAEQNADGVIVHAVLPTQAATATPYARVSLQLDAAKPPLQVPVGVPQLAKTMPVIFPLPGLHVIFRSRSGVHLPVGDDQHSPTILPRQGVVSAGGAGGGGGGSKFCPLMK